MAELLILAVKIVLDLLKCPQTKYQVTPLEACKDPNFFCEAVNGQGILKRNHSYYTQVQDGCQWSLMVWLHCPHKEGNFSGENPFWCFLLGYSETKAWNIFYPFYQNGSKQVCNTLISHYANNARQWKCILFIYTIVGLAYCLVKNNYYAMGRFILLWSIILQMIKLI